MCVSSAIIFFHIVPLGGCEWPESEFQTSFIVNFPIISCKCSCTRMHYAYSKCINVQAMIYIKKKIQKYKSP